MENNNQLEHVDGLYRVNELCSITITQALDALQTLGENNYKSVSGALGSAQSTGEMVLRLLENQHTNLSPIAGPFTWRLPLEALPEDIWRNGVMLYVRRSP